METLEEPCPSEPALLTLELQSLVAHPLVSKAPPPQSPPEGGGEQGQDDEDAVDEDAGATEVKNGVEALTAWMLARQQWQQP